VGGEIENRSGEHDRRVLDPLELRPRCRQARVALTVEPLHRIAKAVLGAGRLRTVAARGLPRDLAPSGGHSR
jgi:hypothetical protein